MLFKNLVLFKFADAFDPTPELLTEKLAEMPFSPCSTLQTSSVGWISPYGDDRLFVEAQGQYMLTLCIESKRVPSSAVKYKLQEAIEKITATGAQVSRAMKKSLKEEITLELMKYAFPRRGTTHIWINTIDKLIGIGVAGDKKAETVLSHLIQTFGANPSAPLVTVKKPEALIRSWLLEGAPEEPFVFGLECELRNKSGSGATIKYSNHVLDTEDIKTQIRDEGKSPCSVGLEWNDSLSFTLTDSLVLKKLKMLASSDTSEEDSDKNALLEAEFMLETDLFSQVLNDLQKNLVA